MERLTRRSKVGEALPIKHMNLMHMDTTSEDNLTNILERLADYEDTNLTPAQLQEIDKLYAEKCKEVVELKEELKKYKENTIPIWIIWEGFEITIDIVSLEYLKDNAEELGENIFLTREEDEKALAEMESKNE